MISMAMSHLYGDNIMGSSAGGSSGSVSPYQPNHALHHGKLGGGGPPPRNAVELQARSLPRPKRKKRRDRQKEKPLYPSIAAVEEAVPEAIISVQDNGVLDIRLPEEEEEEAYEAAPDMEVDTKPAATSRSSTGTTSTAADDNAAAAGHKKKQPRAKGSSRSSTSSSSSSSSRTEKLDTAFRGLSLKRKPVASAPWPMDDDPLGGTVLTLAPRRKVSRHSSRDSNHSRTSADSGDSLGSGPRNLNTRHRRTGSWSSSDSGGSAVLNMAMHNHNNNSNKKPHRSSGTSGSALNSKSPSSAMTLNSSNSTKLGNNNNNGKKSFRRMKSWHDDEVSAEKRAQELEIEPGLFLPLRGSDETLQAIKTGFVEEIFCQACDIELICIADASYCVCPECKCVSPVDGIIGSFTASKNKNKSGKKNNNGNVGLGLRASSQR